MCQTLCQALEEVLVSWRKSLPHQRFHMNSTTVFHNGEAAGTLRVLNWNLGRGLGKSSFLLRFIEWVGVVLGKPGGMERGGQG